MSRSAVARIRRLWRDKRKSAAYAEYVGILRRLTTQLLGVRCIFEIGYIPLYYILAHGHDIKAAVDEI